MLCVSVSASSDLSTPRSAAARGGAGSAKLPKLPKAPKAPKAPKSSKNAPGSLTPLSPAAAEGASLAQQGRRARGGKKGAAAAAAGNTNGKVTADLKLPKQDPALLRPFRVNGAPGELGAFKAPRPARRDSSAYNWKSPSRNFKLRSLSSRANSASNSKTSAKSGAKKPKPSGPRSKAAKGGSFPRGTGAKGKFNTKAFPTGCMNDDGGDDADFAFVVSTLNLIFFSLEVLYSLN